MTDERDDERDDEDGETAPVAPKGPPKKGPKRPPPLGAAPPHFQRTSDEADIVWSDINIWLRAIGGTPYDVYMQVKRITPPAPGGGKFPVGRFGGESAMASGSEAPGAAFIDHMIRYIHLPTTQGPATYEVEFRHRDSGEVVTKGRLDLPDRQTCMNMLNASDAAQNANPNPGMGAVPRMPPAPQQPWPQPQWQAAPMPLFWQPGYGGPPQAPSQPSVPPEMWQMMQSMMTEAFAAGREGRQPNPAMMQPPTGTAAPLNEEALAQRITASVLMSLQKAGIGTQPVAATAPTPTPAPAANGLGSMLEKMTGSLMENIIKATGASMEKSIKQTMGMGAPPATSPDEEDETPEAAAVPVKPEDVLPWEGVSTGASWGDNRPVRFAKNKETGNIDAMGILMENPVIGEKAMAIATGLGEALQEGIKKWTSGAPPPGQAQVVKQIPQAAVDAGVGYTPSKPPDGEGQSGAPAAADNGGWSTP
jgi:hypothetical protein